VGFFSKLFGSEKKAEFDLQEEVAKLLKELPPCTSVVVIASPRYSGSYRAEVFAEASTLADFFERLASSTFGGSQSAQVARVAMPIWLRAGAKHHGSGPSYLPTSFFSQVSTYVQDFVSRGEAAVHCPDCNTVVSGVKTNRRNEQGNALHSEWTTEWRCPDNHLLYTEDHEIDWVRRPVAEAAQIDPLKTCSDLASQASIEVVLEKGLFSAFFIVLGSSGDDFITAIKDQKALQKFVNIIELRIKHRDFEDPYATTNYANLGLPEPTRNLDVPRIVVDRDEKKPLANWAPKK
jgi:hypothetical protein